VIKEFDQYYLALRATALLFLFLFLHLFSPLLLSSTAAPASGARVPKQRHVPISLTPQSAVPARRSWPFPPSPLLRGTEEGSPTWSGMGPRRRLAC